MRALLILVLLALGSCVRSRGARVLLQADSSSRELWDFSNCTSALYCEPGTVGAAALRRTCRRRMPPAAAARQPAYQPSGPRQSSYPASSLCLRF